MFRVTAPVVRCAAFVFSLVCGLIPASAPQAHAQTAQAAYPQALPYIVTAVAGGGTQGNSAPITFGSTTIKANPFTSGASCGTGSPLTATDAFGDGCLATQVVLGTPRGVAVDSQDNLFLVDANNQLIRRVDARTGIITTLAGNGTTAGSPGNPAAGAACNAGGGTSKGLNGDGCLATGVNLASPEGIAVDTAGNVWFTDYLLGSVREVIKSTGVITTIVNTTGGPGYKAGNIANPGTVVPAAQGLLYHPYGLTFDARGNLYIDDYGNNDIEVVNLSSTAQTIATVSIPAGAIFTIAGSGCTYTTTSSCQAAKNYGTLSNVQSTSATLDSPYGVAVDPSGNIYIADDYPYDVRVVNASTGLLTVFANMAEKKFTSAAITPGPAVSTMLGDDYGVATDSYGNVYIPNYDSTTGTGYVARVDAATGNLYVIGGQHETAAPTAPDVQPAGTMLCGAASDGVGDGCPATQATFYRLYQPTVDAAGNVYIVDQGNGLIRKLSAGTQFGTTPVGNTATQTIDIHASAGDTFASSSVPAGTDFSFALNTSTCTTNAAVGNTQDCQANVTFTPTAPGVRTAALTVTSSKGLVSRLALSGIGTGAQLTLDPGTQATLASTGVNGVTALALDAAGNSYAAVPGSGAIVRITPVGVQSNLGTGLSGATAVAVDGAGNVYAALPSGTIAEISAGGAQTTLATGFSAPAGLAADRFSNLYVADASANTVTEIVAGSGVQVTLASGLGGPGALAVDAAGNVFVANTASNSITELPFASTFFGVTVSTGLVTPLSSPAGLAVDAAGSLYVADTGNKRIVYLPSEGGTIHAADAIAIVNGLSAPSGMALAGNGTLYVADKLANTVSTYARSAAAISFGNDQLGTTVSAPADILSSGNVTPAFAGPFATSAGNTADFTLAPVTSVNASFPAPGYGTALTAGFDATATGTRSVLYTFGGTAAQLSLTGNGIKPVNKTTATITATPTNGTYGQTVAVTVAVAVAAGAPSPTGLVTVTVDSSTYMPSLSSTGVATFSLPGLSAGIHTLTANYPGDPLSQPSTATPVTVTLAQAPLTITVNSVSKVFNAPLPTLTGVLNGVVNGDAIGVVYTTTAAASSPLGTYPITATVSGSAVANYQVTAVPGVLSIVRASSVTGLTASSANVNPATQVTLTATVTGSASTATSGGYAPTGSVTFLNGGTVLGSAMLNGSGVATLTTTFNFTGPSSSYAVTASYAGDGNFGSSSSAALTVVSGAPAFALTPAVSSLSVTQGQSGLTSFRLSPNFSYSGPINFTCTGLPATMGCVFSPASITADGLNTAYTIALNVTTTQPGPLASLSKPSSHTGTAMLAALPGLALLLGLAGRRRRTLRGYRLAVFALLGLAGLGLSGCGSGPSTAGTPTGAYVITVVANGTSNVTQQFTLSVTVH